MLKAGNTLECALSWALDCDPKFMQIGQPGHHAIVVLYPLCFPRIDDGYTSRFVHRLMQTASAHEWQANHALAINCAQHARLFFSSVDLGLDTAIPGTFTLTPSAAMRDALARDYAAISGMVFGEIRHSMRCLPTGRSSSRSLMTLQLARRLHTRSSVNDRLPLPTPVFA